MDNKIIITRTFEADIKLVWDAYTSDKHITQWWGPKGFHTVVKLNDFKPGGKWEYIMIDANGTEYPAVGVYKEIIEYQKISSTDDFGEELRQRTDIDFPEITLYTIEFEDLGAQTRITMTYDHPTAEDKEKHIKMGVMDGWNSSLDKLENYLTQLK